MVLRIGQQYRNNLHAFILAAGYGSRMKGMTSRVENKYPIAKPALTVGRHSIVLQQLLALRDSGIFHATVAIKFKGESVRHSLGDLNKLGMDVSFFDLDEHGIEDWGSAWTTFKWHVIEERKGKLSDGIVVLNGDILWDRNVIRPFLESFRVSRSWAQIATSSVPFDDLFSRFGVVQVGEREIELAHNIYLQDCRQNAGNPAAITSARIRYQAAINNILFAQRNSLLPIARFIEKPHVTDIESHMSNLASVGIYALDSKVFKFYSPENIFAPRSFGKDFADFGYHLFQRGLLLDEKPIDAFVAAEGFYWKDIGTPRDFLNANFDVLARRVDIGSLGTEILPNVWIGQRVQVHPSVLDTIKGPVMIGDDVVIGEDAQIGPFTVIGKGWQIGMKADISNSVLLPSYHEEDNVRIVSNRAVIRDSIVSGGMLPTGHYLGKLIVISPEGSLVFYPI